VAVTRSGDRWRAGIAEAAIVRKIFDTYVQDRLGTRAIARLLNDRGHRTATGGAGPATRSTAS